jgi:ATP-dependent DNA helicase RecG
MLSDAELSDLLRDLESDRIERKSTFKGNTSNSIREAICAFANDLPNHRQPGVIFIGVDDNGTSTGYPITDEELLTLANMRSDGNILPFPVMTVQKRIINNCALTVIEVQPADAPPVRFNGRTWIRVGPRRAQATQEEERRLTEKRRWGNLAFDQQPVPGATLEDLDLETFRRTYLPNAVSTEVLEANGRTIEEQLAALRFLSRDGTPTVSAMLLFGKDPSYWIPGAYVQFLRFVGITTDAIQNQKELRGSLSDVLRQLDELLELNITVPSDFTSERLERRNPDYPLVALQQLVRNAVMHRTYESTNAPVRLYWFSDRIEIHSPGGLYGQVTPENFGQPSATDYRNPTVAEAMKVLGYVQRFGLGISLAQRALQQNGNPSAQFDFQGGSYVLVTLRRPS